MTTNYKIEPKKVTKYFAEVEIKGKVYKEDMKGVYTEDGKVMARKKFDSMLRAQKWVAKMIVMDELGYLGMDWRDRNSYKRRHDSRDFYNKVNKVGKELFDRRLYKDMQTQEVGDPMYDHRGKKYISNGE